MFWTIFVPKLLMSYCYTTYSIILFLLWWMTLTKYFIDWILNTYLYDVSYHILLESRPTISTSLFPLMIASRSLWEQLIPIEFQWIIWLKGFKLTEAVLWYFVFIRPVPPGHTHITVPPPLTANLPLLGCVHSLPDKSLIMIAYQTLSWRQQVFIIIFSFWICFFFMVGKGINYCFIWSWSSLPFTNAWAVGNVVWARGVAAAALVHVITPAPGPIFLNCYCIGAGQVLARHAAG